MDISKIAAASFMPSFQNSGQISGTATLSGTLDASPSYPTNTSNMVNQEDANNNPIPLIIPLENPSVITVLRVNFPDAAGQLASRWFPINGVGIFYDYTNQWKLLLYEFSHPQGRTFYYNFVNMQNSAYTFTNFRINIYGHLYSYAW